MSCANATLWDQIAMLIIGMRKTHSVYVMISK